MDKRCSLRSLRPFAKYSEMASWPSFSTLTPNCFFFSRMGRIAARFSTQIRIKQGIERNGSEGIGGHPAHGARSALDGNKQ